MGHQFFPNLFVSLQSTFHCMSVWLFWQFSSVASRCQCCCNPVTNENDPAILPDDPTFHSIISSACKKLQLVEEECRFNVKHSLKVKKKKKDKKQPKL
jgi:hypothetical protein